MPRMPHLCSRDILTRCCAVLLAVACVIFGGASLVRAHSSGVSFQQASGRYTVDVGYNPESFIAGEYASFDFLLWDGPADISESAQFAHVWVRIVRDRSTQLATGVFHQEYGPTTLVYMFPLEGDYTLEVSYRTASGDEIAEASFPIMVAPSPEVNIFRTYLLPVALVVAGMAGGLFLSRMKTFGAPSRHAKAGESS